MNYTPFAFTKSLLRDCSFGLGQGFEPYPSINKRRADPTPYLPLSVPPKTEERGQKGER
jgi:hypothetical protein